MTLLLVRHAKAGDRRAWSGPDVLRPLSDSGVRQAKGLLEQLLVQLGERGVERILSSPARRCVQTVEPLATAFGVPIEHRAELAEGAEVEPVIRLAHELTDTTAVLCSHGDLIPEVLEVLAVRDGLKLPAAHRWAKGSTWILEPTGGRYRHARYVPPAD
ncbi:MAG: SixA phosphatase family protein [Acidimicrobiales bacterium]